VKDQCIWCGNSSIGKQSIEHIVPKAIGCPDGFVLKNGEVCKNCNNGMGHLDQALIGDFEIPALIAGVPRGNDKGPRVHSYGNTFAHQSAQGTELFINMDAKAIVLKNGFELGGFKGRERDLKWKLSVNGNEVKATGQFYFGKSPKVARSLYKIGLSWVAYSLGSNVARTLIQSSIGSFVKKGYPVRPVFLYSIDDPNRYRHEFSGHITKDGKLVATSFVLAGCAKFVIDLTDDLSFSDVFYRASISMLGTESWTKLPPTWIPKA